MSTIFRRFTSARQTERAPGNTIADEAAVTALSEPAPPPVLDVSSSDQDTVITTEQCPAATEPSVTIPWAGVEPTHEEVDADADTSTFEDELPPSYASTETISEPTKFTFVQASFDALHLLLPGNAPAPLLTVSVALNVFNPSAYITTVRRGASADGPVLGSFEMSASSGSGFVAIRGQRRVISRVFVVPFDGNRRTVWMFYEGQYLAFKWRGDELSCYVTQGPTRWDTDHPLSLLRAQALRASGGRETATLTLWPDAYNDVRLLAQTILGTLILERRRQVSASKALRA